MIEVSLVPAASARRSVAAWRDPAGWLRGKQLSRGYWTFFAAAFFFDAGFAVYYFLFNLYLLGHGYNERQIGWVGSALTMGSIVGTLPAGMLTRRVGLRRILLLLFIIAPLLHTLRIFFLWQPLQMGVAFLSGLAMSFWGVCFLPAVARLTSEGNRAAAYSLIFSASVGTSMLGGIVCGYLGKALASAGFILNANDNKRIILVCSCVIVLLGLLPLMRLRLPQERLLADVDKRIIDALSNESWYRKVLRRCSVSPFLLRFLVCMALWSGLLAAFTPFANIYLVRNLHVTMEQVGLLFSIVQLMQFGMGMLAPVVFRALGLIKGIAAMQAACGLLLLALAVTGMAKVAVPLFLIFSAVQWMSSPGLYNLLMTGTPECERSSAAASTLFVNALAGSAATALGGILFSRFGYPPVLAGIACFAVVCALLLLFLISGKVQDHRAAA